LTNQSSVWKVETRHSLFTEKYNVKPQRHDQQMLDDVLAIAVGQQCWPEKSWPAMLPAMLAVYELVPSFIVGQQVESHAR